MTDVETHPNQQTHHRDPDQVMRLARLGSLHQCRLSFMRQLTRRMAHEGWTVTREAFVIDANGVGHAVYSVNTGTRVYSLVAFAHDLPPDQRTDRVIAEAWDATFALFDGTPSEADLSRLSQNVPKQEAGRVSERELCLSRANRSVRLWEHVVAALAKGAQPDARALTDVGYLMRTTAVYGSGKFGAADRDLIEERKEMSAPFQAEMLTVYLIRSFVRDLVNHMAAVRGGETAVLLDDHLAQGLGIGNSTGLGMAPFIVNHPILFNNWLLAREEAIARVRALTDVRQEDWDMVANRAARVHAQVAAATTHHPVQRAKNQDLLADLDTLQARMAQPSRDPLPWNALVQWSTTTLTLEGQECLLSLILEPYPKLVDGLGHCMSDHLERDIRLDGTRSVEEMRALLQATYAWAFKVDWTDPAATARAWYVSEEKQEPRLGERHEEPIAAYEHPLCTGRDATLAVAALESWPAESLIAAFVLRHPEFRRILRRAQISAFAPYSEIRDNLLAHDMRPIDMLRAKLAFFGATEFDPRSDRWVRIKMFAGAPYPEALTPDTADQWVFGLPLAQ